MLTGSWKIVGNQYRESVRTVVRLFVLTLVSLHSAAQPTFNQLSTSDGLSHNTVMDLLQDSKGFLWLGTADGLNRYDGERFQVFRRSARDAQSLSSNEIKCLLEDRQHRLWVGTNSGGLNQLDSSGVRFRHLLHTVDGQDIATATITDLAQDQAGRIWASTNGQGLLLIDPATGRVSQLTAAKNGLPSNFIHRVCPDRAGNLWLGDQQGRLTQLRLTDYRITPVTLPAPEAAAAVSIMTIRCDSRGRVWVGTQGKGLFRSESGQTNFQVVFYHPGVVEGVNIARSLYEDAQGKFWLGTDDGVIVADDSDFRQISHLQHDRTRIGSISTHATVCVRGDRQGTIWVGTWEGGLNVLFARPNPFSLYTYRPGQPASLLAPTVATVAADSLGNVWVGSTQGLSYLNRTTNTYRHFRHQPGSPHTLPGNDVTYVYRLSKNALLVTIWNKGTFLIDPRTGQVRKHLKLLGSGLVHTITPTRGGKAWVATKQGDRWLIDRQTGQLTPVGQLVEASISLTSLLETTDGALWGGTFGNGLTEWPPQNGRVRHHYGNRKPGGLYDNHVTCLFEDRRHQLWVGTMNGLHRYDPHSQRFTLIATDNGLPNDAIMSIGQDADGNLWVATNDGLCRLSEAGRVVRTYRRDDGLVGNDFTERAVSQSADGTMFWGGKHGLTVFRPNQLKAAEPPVPVYLTELKLFNQPVLPGSADSPLTHALADTKAITLRYSQSVITLDFAAVLFRAHRNVRYAYRLDEFEEAWNYVGSQHSATYTNQSPGAYQFRVKASLTDDFRNAPETVLQLTILPPWYRTGWAYALYALLVTGLLLGMRRLIQIRESYKTELRAEHLETEKARELDRLRSGFFTNISHEFRTPLTLILTPLEQFMTDSAPDSRRPQFQTMHQNANRLLRLINQLLDLSKLESDSLRPDISRQDVIGFVRRVVNSFTAQATRQHITLCMETESETYAGWFDPDIVEKVLYNLIANALKFTPNGGSITVRCQILQDAGSPELLLDVDDSGMGISPEHTAHIFERFYQVNGQNRAKKAGTGIGLALTRELVELHRGQIRVESQPGIGSVFVVTLPIHASAFPVSWLSTYPADSTPTTDDQVPIGQVPSGDNMLSLPCLTGADVPVVLVVEDHDDLRHYLAGCLGQHYRVLTATNGRQGLEQAQAEIPDLIVSDWLMPDMDGVQLCQTLKTDERTSHIPLVLLTSRSSTESKLEGLGAGADDYVTKPFNLDVLLSRARNLIQSRRLLRVKYSRILTLRSADPDVVESAETMFLHKIMTLIETHLADPDLDVQRLERELGLSNTQLYRKLKALTGKGGNELIRSVRLQRAAQLLQAGGRQVAEVAYAVGFNDPNYFIRAFRKEFGQSPGEWGKKGVGV
ncbi:hybrid sensor histidine kinase/response regulator transcription factor [Spirosoma areae]